MKIGILTYHFSDNYGALFQAYALRQWFLDQGHHAEFINYHPDYVESGGRINISNLFSKQNLKVVYLKLSKLQRQWLGNKQLNKEFDYFRNHYLGITDPEFKTIYELEKFNHNYDLLVCGSDQIWNPSEQFGLDPVYFLNFKTKKTDVRRISYAPSFGRGEVDVRFHAELKSMLKLIDAISIREQSGVPIIENLIGTKPACVPDPTILLEDYSNIMKPYELTSKKHVFCYGLRSRDVIGDVAENISEKLGCALYSPYNAHRRWKEIGKTVYPCPRQWLYLLNSSEFVVTNSFHGTALSILLNKPFVFVGLLGVREKFNSRALNLLGSVGLQARFINNFDSNTIKELCDNPINWDDVNNKLAYMRNVGSSYLIKQIDLAR